MKAKFKRSEAAFIRRWTVYTGLGLGLGTALVMLTYLGIFDRGTYDGYLIGLIFRAMLQLLPMALFQHLLFRYLNLNISHRSWIVATIAGGGIVVALQVLVASLPIQSQIGWTLNYTLGEKMMLTHAMEGQFMLMNYANYEADLAPILGGGVRLVSPYLLFIQDNIIWAMLCGTLTSIFQYLFLRRVVRSAWQWIAFGTASYGMIIPIGSSLYATYKHSFDSRVWFHLFRNYSSLQDGWVFFKSIWLAGVVIFFELAMGLAIGWIMANLLVRLKRDEIPDWIPEKHKSEVNLSATV